MNTTEYEDYPIHAAGRIWTVRKATLTELRDGTMAISQAELNRIHRAIANSVCARPDLLSAEELEFLCDITGTAYTEVAAVLEVDKSTITLWRRKGTVPKRSLSLVLKRWFWFRIFGQELADTQLPLSAVGSDEELLALVHDEAIEQNKTFEVEERRAS